MTTKQTTRRPTAQRFISLSVCRLLYYARSDPKSHVLIDAPIAPAFTEKSGIAEQAERGGPAEDVPT